MPSLGCLDTAAAESFRSAPLFAAMSTLRRVSGGCVRGLQQTDTAEAEAALRGGSLLVPRLVRLVREPWAKSAHMSDRGSADHLADMRSELDAFVVRESAASHSDRRGTATAAEDARSMLLSLCSQYVHRAVVELASDSDLSGDEQSDGPKWHLRLLWAWCAKQPRPDAASMELTPAAVCAAYPELHAEVRLAERAGEHLADALRGKLSFQELLFPDGSMDLMRPAYEDSALCAFYNRCVVAAVRAFLERHGAAGGRRAASGQPKSVRPPVVALEVGAGTGGTATTLLPELDGACSCYYFTDVSRVFLEQARTKFDAMWGGFLRYALLNIDADPTLQGFGSGSIDLVVATNCLHATPHVRRALRHCHKLLSPRGFLVANEGLETDVFAQNHLWPHRRLVALPGGGTPNAQGRTARCSAAASGSLCLLMSALEATHWMRGEGASLAGQAVVVAQAAAESRPTVSGLAARARRPATAASAADGDVHVIGGGLGGLGLLTARLILETDRDTTDRDTDRATRIVRRRPEVPCCSSRVEERQTRE